jgi:hypothetical protein
MSYLRLHTGLCDGRAEGKKIAKKTIIKVKVKFTLEQAMKAQRGSRGIALLFI